MNAAKVSIIIPVYNASLYLEQCLRSVLEQTLQDIEVIIVNDGSADDSLAIIRSFEKQDKRIIVINSTTAGVSAARNKGLAIANGEWIAFVDADDWIEREMLETLYRSAIQSGSGMSVCNIAVVTKGESLKMRLSLNEEIIDFKNRPADAVEAIMNFKFDYANWNKLYNGDTVRQNNLRFDEHISIGEDLLFNLYYVHFSERIVINNRTLYHYRMHENSAMAGIENKRIEQYNLQFEAYKTFTDRRCLTKEWETFRSIMARGCYNTLIPAIIKNITRTNPGYFSLVTKLSSELEKFKNGIYYFPGETRSGLQGFKKNLLRHKRFRLFAMLVSLKHSRINT